ncbi:MAG: sigma 54-interacting transcriptional regulator [Desulfotomaculaceae bacterium]|nr:sigma 54-interacting transcriptional regulator [Desulfotomaculaceae bacterium]
MMDCNQNFDEMLGELHYLRSRLVELEVQNRDYWGMFENSYDAMCIADCDGRLRSVNPAFERSIGIKTMDVLGRPIQDIINKGLTDASATLRILESGNKEEETVIINTRIGTRVLSTGIPTYDHKGKLLRVYCNMRDVTNIEHLKQDCMQSQRLISKYLLESLESKRGKSFKFIANSKQMQQLLETVYQIASVDSTVLILGETGVGKDIIAHIIHDASPRSRGPFLKINCGAIPADLLESELFGYDGGAFTGANRSGKPGFFELANKGTIFLDEIGDLPKKLQVKLLAVIQDQRITRIGGVKEKQVDVRVITATNRDLEEMVRQGEFREDLFYRLNVVPISIPPLHERKEDIPYLISHYTEIFNQKYNRKVLFSNEAVKVLNKYNWPGNVRELANLVERVVVTSRELLVLPEFLPKKYLLAPDDEHQPDFKSLREAVEEYELQFVKKVADLSNSRKEAADKLGISLSSLTRRLRKLQQVEGKC